MYVLGIDETAADALLHVDKVKLYNAGNQTPVFIIESLADALLAGNLEIDT